MSTLPGGTTGKLVNQVLSSYNPAVKYGVPVVEPDTPIVSVEYNNVPVGIFYTLNFSGTGISSITDAGLNQVDISVGTATTTPESNSQTGLTGTIITLPSAPTDEYRLFKNGVLQEEGGVDYTLVGNTVSLVTAAVAGDLYKSLYVTGGITGTYTRNSQTGLTGTAVTLPSTPTSELRVFKNGQLLEEGGVDYTQAGTAITLAVALIASDRITSIYNA